MGEVIGIVITIAVICIGIYFAFFVVFRIIAGIIYFFKWLKWTPAERAYEKRIRRRKYKSNSSNSSDSSGGWWSFDSASSDCGGGDGGGGGGD